MTRTRIIFIGILVITGIIIGVAMFTTNQREQIIGLVGSEKVPFFSDERVQDELRKNGLEVTVQKSGSREIANMNLNEYDFAFPAGVPAATKIQQEKGITASYDPFFTPMAIASWKPIADLLVTEGIATDQGGYYTLDMEAFLTLMQNETRWNELNSNTTFDVNKGILLTSTDIRTSNSAAMYLSLASYVANGDNILESLTDAQPLLPLMSDLFLRQGLRPSTSQEPFEDYLVKGMGHSPIVMIYEAQFIAQAAQVPGSILPDMVLMYPEPTIFTKHVFIPVSEGGGKLGELLETDPELQQLAIEYGLRNSNLVYFREFTNGLNITLPDNLVSVVDPPSFEVLEGMITHIENQYDQ